MSSETKAPQAGAALPVGVAPVRAMTGAEWGMLGLLSMLWGCSFLFHAVALRDLPILTIVAARVLIAALVLHLVLRVTGRRFPLDRPTLFAFAGMSILNNVIPFNLIVFGQSHITSGLASILNATTPIFGMVLAHLFTDDDRMGPRKFAGVLLGFTGVVVLFSGRDLLSQAAWIGQLACIAASMSYGVSGLFGRRFARLGIEPVMISAGQLTMSALVMVPVALIVDAPFARAVPGWPSLLAVLALAVASTAGAYILFFRILTRAGANNALLVTLLVPCSAILLGAIVLGESLGWRELAGFAVIASGLLVIDGRVLARFRRAA